MFPENERLIFEYHDGTSTKFGDPLLIEERLFGHLADAELGNLERDLDGDDQRLYFAALGKLLPAARVAFRLADFDEDTGAGLPGEAVLSLLARYFAWRNEKKGSTGDGPSTPPSSGGPPASPTPTPTTSAST